MGNGVRKLSLCFTGNAAGETSGRKHNIAVYLSNPLDEGLGHSFCYIRPDPTLVPDPQFHGDETTTFKTISGASISANTSTPPSTAVIDFYPCNDVVEKSSAFVSSDDFASIPLQPIPRDLVLSATRSGPIPNQSGSFWCSGPVERGFLSGPMERQSDRFPTHIPKTEKSGFIRCIKRAMPKSIVVPIRGAEELNLGNGYEKDTENLTVSSSSDSNFTSSDDDDTRDSSFEYQNLQWAQGKAGEDRVHMVISEEHGWVFVGIYDGFNGPDATDFLANNLYCNIQKELKGLLWDEKPENISQINEPDQTQMRKENNNYNSDCADSKTKKEGLMGTNHFDVLGAISEGLRKTEESYLEIADLMLRETPELCLMGSCVLGMLMKGEDVYLMNVGDSRAVIGQKAQSDLGIGKGYKELARINENDEIESLPKLKSLQLTMDHSTCVKEEVKRIRNEHLDDPCAISNERVKGSLKVTRAFGAGFLKKPKWNNALLEMFRIEYVGTSPYINCLPSLHHRRLSPMDRFLILSSDGLYQYFTNEEVVIKVEKFTASFPEGDPAQHLIEEVLFRAAKKAGMDFHELLDIPQGDRRKYHDDISIIIISLEGRIWRSTSV